MIDRFLSGGFIMWPMLVVVLGIVWIAVRTALRLREVPSRGEEVGKGLQAILFWGAMGAVLGTVGTLVGLVVMAGVIEGAGTVGEGLVWGGVATSLVSFVFGILVFLFAGGCWLLLHTWHLRSADRAHS